MISSSWVKSQREKESCINHGSTLKSIYKFPSCSFPLTPSLSLFQFPFFFSFLIFTILSSQQYLCPSTTAYQIFGSLCFADGLIASLILPLRDSSHPGKRTYVLRRTPQRHLWDLASCLLCTLAPNSSSAVVRWFFPHRPVPMHYTWDNSLHTALFKPTVTG